MWSVLEVMWRWCVRAIMPLYSYLRQRRALDTRCSTLLVVLVVGWREPGVGETIVAPEAMAEASLTYVKISFWCQEYFTINLQSAKRRPINNLFFHKMSNGNSCLEQEVPFSSLWNINRIQTSHFIDKQTNGEWVIKMDYICCTFCSWSTQKVCILITKLGII